MKCRFLSTLISLIFGASSYICNAQGITFEQVIINELSAKEVDDGWELLFDGISTKSWRNFHQDRLVDGWKVEEGNLIGLGKGGDLGGDIITLDQYEDLILAKEKIQDALKKDIPILIRHHNDVDGYAAAIALESVIMPSIKKKARNIF